jgi:steroid delta-isomerase-like uncharacterized protein
VPKAVARKPKQQDAEKILRDYFEATGRRDLDAMASFWKPDVVEDITGVGILRGEQELRGFFAELFAAVPDLETTPKRIVPHDDVCVVEWRMRGNFSGGPLMGIEATGVWLEMRGCDVFELEDGKIARYTAYQDGMELARAIGMLPPRESAAEKAMFAAFNGVTKVRQAIRARRAG